MPVSTEERLEANTRRLEEALRSIGYSFETAVADIIDNSIDARARNVLVRIIYRKDGQLDLVVWDDGDGMDPNTLKEAMRFGADVTQEVKRLGKFGLGLKLASLSQAREFRVVTTRNGVLSGRAYREHSIADGFICTVFDTAECKQFISEVIPDKPSIASATLVWWSRLYRIGHQHNSPEEHAQKLLRRLENALPLTFHRYLSGRASKVAITVDIQEQGSGEFGIPEVLDPLDPFGYGDARTGHPGFPARMLLEGAYKDQMAITAHIWPPNSDLPEYKLPGGANRRQGFYFYRNNRLIQGGGWNGLRETEPHSSLARLEVEIGVDFDVEISLDVKKTEIQLPPDVVGAIQRAKTSKGDDFKKYLAIADEAYRKRKMMHAELPLIPSDGLPSELTKFLHKELRIKATAKHRDLKIRWKSLPRDRFFEIDRERGRLYLNRSFRRRLLHGLSGSSADIPVVKCLLFLVLEDALSSERMGPRIRERYDQVNRILLKAVKYERSPE